MRAQVVTIAALSDVSTTTAQEQSAGAVHALQLATENINNDSAILPGHRLVVKSVNYTTAQAIGILLLFVLMSFDSPRRKP